MVTPTHFLPFFSKPLGILDTEGKKIIIKIIIIIIVVVVVVVTRRALSRAYTSAQAQPNSPL